MVSIIFTLNFVWLVGFYLAENSFSNDHQNFSSTIDSNNSRFTDELPNSTYNLPYYFFDNNTTMFDIDLSTSKISNSASVLFNFGTEYGDSLIQYNQSSFEGPIKISANLSYFGLTISEIFISINGLISFFEPIPDFFISPFPTLNYISIAAFWNSIDSTKGGDIYHREITDAMTLEKISLDISSTIEQFNATWAYLVTWYEVAPYYSFSDERNSFQVLLASNGNVSYTILNYEKLEWSSTFLFSGHAQVGFNFGDGYRFLSLPGSLTENVLNLANDSNVGVLRRWIYRTDDPNFLNISCNSNIYCFNFTNSIFYESGSKYGDSVIQKNDDFYEGPIGVSKNFSFFGKYISEIFINTNGLISFLQPITEYSPIPFPTYNYISIAGFWNDIDTTKGGDIFYREITDTITLQKISQDISSTVEQFNATWAYLVTWYEVAPYSSLLDQRNSFQILLASNGNVSFTIFNYEKLEWSFNLYSYIFGQVGFNFGDGSRSLSLPGSLTENVLNLANDSNIGVPGRWIYRIDDSDILDCSSYPYLSRFFFYEYYSIGGEELLLSGLCLKNGQKAFVLIDDHIEVECFIIEYSNCLITTPFLNKTGPIKSELFIDNNSSFTFTLNIVKEPGLAENFLVDIKPFYNMSNDEIVINFSPFFSEYLFFYEFFYDVYLIRIQNDTAELTQIDLVSNESLSINSSLLYKNSPKVDVEIFYIGLSYKYFFTRKYELLFPLLIINELEIADEICQSWYGEQPDPNPIVQVLPPCPPNLPFQQPPFFFSNFITDLCNPFNDEFCSSFHPGAKICYKSIFSVQVGSQMTGQQCCYDQQGTLLVGPPGGGSLDLHHSLDYEREHVYVDIFPYIRCCILSNNCDLYYEKRPSDNGELWQPPAFGGGAGDPHFTSFDGVRYTFNGYGEYTYFEIKEKNFSAQVKIAPLSMQNGTESQGTVFKAISIRGNETGNIEINLDFNKLNIKVNEWYLKSSQMFMSLKGLFLNSTENKVELVYDNGISFEIQSTPNHNALLIFTSLPQFFKGQTTGLMGNFNGNNSDDFTLPNGTVLDLNPQNDKDIFEYFGQEWQVSENMSFFDNDNEFKQILGRNAAYVPKFMQDGISFENSTLEEQAKEVCGNDAFCLFDVSITGDISIASTNLNLNSLISSFEQITSRNSSNSSLDTTDSPSKSSSSETTLISTDSSKSSSSETTLISTDSSSKLSSSKTTLISIDSSSSSKTNFVSTTTSNQGDTATTTNNAKKNMHFGIVFLSFVSSMLFLGLMY
ncbi:sushi domain-containing 2-like [Brachionus plicatilis]|uniref:Sushi domain-containing 2-like n=1 Tax=Brachionus plicatilis TaxID=10195 RepID=A0A3M7PXY4_BRAPC|nr:sushi domain-containing 2-like [Brachionus plicatilis]